MRQPRHLGVLLRHALLGVDEDKAHVAALDRHGGAEDAVFFDIVVHLGLFPHTGGVDEVILAVAVLKVAVDGVAGGARHVADDDALLPQNAVGETGFAHVGLADDGYLHHIVVVLVLRLRREILDALVQQVAGAVTVDGGDRHRVAQPQVVELVEVRVKGAGGVHLVHRQHDGLAAALEHIGDLLVGGGQAGLDVGDENNDVGVVNGDLRLLPHESEDLAVGVGLDTAGVHQTEFAPHPLAFAVDTVTGDAGGVLHDGQPPPDDLVEQHGLTHIGASHNSN